MCRSELDARTKADLADRQARRIAGLGARLAAFDWGLAGLAVSPGGLSRALAHGPPAQARACGASFRVMATAAGTSCRSVPLRTNASALDLAGDDRGVLVSDCLGPPDDLAPVVSRIWWKSRNGGLRAWRSRPDQAAWSRAEGSMGRGSTSQPSTLRMLPWPEASGARSSEGTVSAQGRTVRVLLRRRNSFRATSRASGRARGAVSGARNGVPGRALSGFHLDNDGIVATGADRGSPACANGSRGLRPDPCGLGSGRPRRPLSGPALRPDPGVRTNRLTSLEMSL